jgi:hypothetical protein
MPSTCFEPEGSSSGTRLCVQVRYGAFYMHRYKQSSRQNSVLGTYSSVHEHEPSGSKHVDDIKMKIKILT